MRNPEGMTRRIVVVGAGLVGACAAWRLAQGRGEVTLLEGALPSSGATGTSFAWVGASYQDVVNQPDYFRLKLEASKARGRMAADLGGHIGLHRTGLVVWSSQVESATSLAKGLTQVREAGIEAELLSRDQTERIEPEVRIPEDALVIGFCPDDGYVVGQTMVAAALRAARRNGAAIRVHTEVTEIVCRGGRVTGVSTADGEIVAADEVVVAAGAATGQLVQTAGGSVPLVPPSSRGSDAIGLIVTTEPCASLLRRLVVNDRVMFRPDGGGRLVIHSYDVDREVFSDDAPSQLLRYGQQAATIAAEYMSSDPWLTVSSARVGIRPLPVDGLSVVGRIPGASGLYVAVTHSGITLGPLLGELIAEEVLHDRELARLGPFRPDRFQAEALPAAWSTR
jgi:glycine/D-amino acid oxidase-like deaminating enzyme